MSRASQSQLAVALVSLAAIPSFFVLDISLALWRGWRTTNATWIVLLAVSSIVLLATGVAWVLSAGRRWLRGRAAKLLALHLSIVVCWTVFELVTSAVVGQTLWFHRNTPGQTFIFTPKPEYIPGVQGPSRVIINGMGVRGSDPPARGEAYRILCIGGSTTQCLYLDQERTWPEVLMRKLNAAAGGRRSWVGNMGQSGLGSSDHVRFLATGELLDEVDCVLCLVGVNELLRGLRGERIEAAAGVRPLWVRSPVFAFFHNWYQARKESLRTFHEDADGAAYAQRRRSWRAAEPAEELPDLSAALAGYRSNLEWMIRHARAHGVRIVFATQPALWRAGLSDEALQSLWLGWVDFGKPQRLPPAVLAEGLGLFNQELAAVCREHGVELIDLSAVDGVEELYYDDCHFTDAGAERVAAILAGWFAEQG